MLPVRHHSSSHQESPLSHFTPSFDLPQHKRYNFPCLGVTRSFLSLPLPGISQVGGTWSVGNEELLPNSTNAKPSRNPTRSFFMLRADPGNQDRSRELLPGSFICFPTLHHHLLLILWADSLGVIRGEPSSSLDWDLQRNEFSDEVTSPQRADSCRASALPQVYVLGLVPWKRKNTRLALPGVAPCQGLDGECDKVCLLLLVWLHQPGAGLCCTCCTGQRLTRGKRQHAGLPRALEKWFRGLA